MEDHESQKHTKKHNFYQNVCLCKGFLTFTQTYSRMSTWLVSRAKKLHLVFFPNMDFRYEVEEESNNSSTQTGLKWTHTPNKLGATSAELI